eukprot:1409505-Rhodomonas_salina.1
MLDATKPDAHKAVLEAELESTGIRLNKQPADIYFRKKKTGGIKFNAMVATPGILRVGSALFWTDRARLLPGAAHKARGQPW